MLERMWAAGRHRGDDGCDPFVHRHRKVQQAGVAAQREGGKFGQPGTDVQRHAGRNCKAGLSGRLQRGGFGRTAAEENLQPAFPPIPCDGDVPVERPVFPGRAGERLNKKRWTIERQFVSGQETARLLQGAGWHSKFVEDLTGMQPALMEQR